jgi:uncharacterized membrane protein
MAAEPVRTSSAEITVPPPEPASLARALEGNIAALKERRLSEEAAAGAEERVADTITRFAGSMRFVYIHLALFGSWVLINVGVVPWLPQFDPTFVILATWASVEAIFLSTFVLISQNRAAAVADRRADLNLQISLLSEHEVTKLVKLTTAIAGKLRIRDADDPELEELMRDVAPEAVLNALEQVERAPRRLG